ncbi:MAG: hypothetical protein KGD60_07715 [Candidatus Thorarchaeota archaeon]|nr:hypothetical protein [Candidatus Thorarchaeota archaeon]
MPRITYLSSRMDGSLVSLPGSPLEETTFARLVDSTLHAAAYNGTWSLDSEIPYQLSLRLPSDRVSLETAREHAESFVNDSLLRHLEYASSSTKDMTRWGFIFENYTNQVRCLIVQVIINSISGQVIGYKEIWNAKANVSSDLLDFYPFKETEPLSEPLANSIAADFLESHNYTLLPASRHIRTTPTITDEHLNELMQEGFNSSVSPDLYEVVISTPVGMVFPDKQSSGIRLRLSASTGRIISFFYDFINIPNIDVNEVGILNVQAARRSALGDNSQFPEASVEWGNGTLRLVRLDPYRQQSIQFQLAWTFRVTCLLFGDIEVSGEYAVEVDAISGNFHDLHPGLYFENPVVISNILSVVAMIFSGSFVVSGICVLGYRRRYKQILRSVE